MMIAEGASLIGAALSLILWFSERSRRKKIVARIAVLERVCGGGNVIGDNGGVNGEGQDGARDC